MNAFPTDAHLHITVEPRLTRHLSQTIQTVELLELNAEGLYEYLAQAAEANPMMLVQRTPCRSFRFMPAARALTSGTLACMTSRSSGRIFAASSRF